MPSPLPSARRLTAITLASVALTTACGGPPKAAGPPMERFNAALCPKLPVEDATLPLDPNLEGVKADLGVLDRMVNKAGSLRLSLTFRNIGQHGLNLLLPREAFMLEGFELVDHACVRVPYAKSAAATALAYSNSGPMPLAVGESATVDSTLSSLAPTLDLPRGIYAIRFALRAPPGRSDMRGRTIRSDWALFAVTPTR